MENKQKLGNKRTKKNGKRTKIRVNEQKKMEN
jgi:hypothetical protein